VRHSGGHVGLWAAAGLAFLAVACGRASQPADPPSPTFTQTDADPSSSQPASDASQAVTPSPPAADTGEIITLHGWFTIVWNDQAHTFLTDDAGDTRELLLDESLTGPLGGPLALDRKRVVITAEAVEGRPEVLRVTSIVVEAGE